jgi:hypothetical protein
MHFATLDDSVVECFIPSLSQAKKASQALEVLDNYFIKYGLTNVVTRVPVNRYSNKGL